VFVANRIPVRPMASALLRRRLAHKIALPRRCLFSSTSSVLAQAAPESHSSSSTTTTATGPPGGGGGGGGKNVFSRHIAEELQGVTASEILAESGTRKDAQMRHFTGEWFFLLVSSED
jgi:NADH dehydrogenase (ubiquinone) Fe-S protein 2